MPVSLGNTNISKLYLGSTEITKAYLGVTEVFSNLWTPSEITTALWLDAGDASTITTSGTDVSQWNDKSGNNSHATQSSGSLQPDYDLTGFDSLYPAVVFNSSYLEIDSFTLNAAHSIFAVSYITNNSSLYADLLRPIPVNEDFHFGRNDNNFSVFYGLDDNSAWHDVSANTPASSVTTSSIMSAVSNGAGTATPYYNGAALNNKTSRTITINKNLSIGSNGNLVSNNWNGPVSEIIILNYTVDLITRQKLEGYLAHKWGLTAKLPGGHPYKTDAPTV